MSRTLLHLMGAAALGAGFCAPLPSHAQAQAQGQASTDWRAFDACMACHARDKALVGPSFQAIRERYAGQAEAAAQLAQRIAQGSSGRWGSSPMPANSALSEAQALAAARWILGEKPPSSVSSVSPTTASQADLSKKD